MESRGKGFVGSDWLVSGLQLQAVFHLVVQELGVLHQLLVTVDTGIAGDANHLSAVVASVYAAHTIKSTCKGTVFQGLHAVITSFILISTLAVDADGGAEGPAASITVEV